MLRQTHVVYVGGYCLSEQPSPEKIAALFYAVVEFGVRTVLDVVIARPANYWPFLEPFCRGPTSFFPTMTKARRSRNRGSRDRRFAFVKRAPSR